MRDFDLTSAKTTAELLDVEQSKPKNALSEFVNTAVYTATSAPLRGLAQIADHNLKTDVFDKSVKGTFEAAGVKAPNAADFNTSSWYAQQLGGAVGMTLPFLALRGGVKNIAAAAVGESVALKSALDVGVTHSLSKFAMQEAVYSGTAGLFYGLLLNPSDEKLVGTEAFAKDRVKYGLSDLAVFSTLSLTAPFIGKGLATGSKFLEAKIGAPLLGEAVAATLRGPVLPGALSGLPAGLVAAEATAIRDGRWVPTAQELKENITGMMFVGGSMSSAHWLGAQREGTNKTNARHYADKMGLTTPADPTIANFKVVEGKDQLSRFHQEVQSGAQNAQAQVMVRQQLETLSSALSGPGGKTWGDARVLQLEHRANGIMPARTAGSFGLIGTCSIIEGNLATRDVFTGRSAAADRTVMLTPKADYSQLSLSVGRNSADKVGVISSTERLSPVALGEESKGPESAKPAESEANAPADGVQIRSFGEIRAPRRWTGPSEKLSSEAFNIFGNKLESDASVLLAFNKTGTINDINRATSVASFGRDSNGWPFISVDSGRELWSMNGRSLRPGRNFIDVKGNDRLTFDNSLAFDFQRKGQGGPGGMSTELQLQYRVDADLAKQWGPSEAARGDRDAGRFGDRDGGRFGDRDGGRFGDRDGGRFGDRDRGRFGDRDGGRFGDRDGGRFGDRDGRFRDGPEAPPEKQRELRPGGDFEIGEGKFRVFGKMLARPGDNILLPLHKDGTRGTVMKNDSMAKFGLDAAGEAYFRVDYGQEMWSLNGEPVAPKTPYKIGPSDNLVFNGHEFELSNKRTPHGNTALDLGIKPKSKQPEAPKAQPESSEAAEAAVAAPRALTPDLNLLPPASAFERSYIATAEQRRGLMGTYEAVQKEILARKAAEAEAAAAEAAKITEAETANPAETRPVESAENRGSEPAPSENRPVETEAKNEPARTNEEPPSLDNNAVKPAVENGGTGSPAVDALLQSPLDAVLKPLVLTEEASAAIKPAIESIKAPEAKIQNPAELMENDLVSINGKQLEKGTELKIGRFPGIDIQIAKDPSIAQLHGYIGINAEGQLYIKDKSTTGMKVNGKAIQSGEAVLINPNDVVTVGRNNKVLEIKVERPEQ